MAHALTLDAATADEPMAFSDCLANMRTLDMADCRLALYIVKSLSPYYEMRSRKSGALGDLVKHIPLHVPPHGAKV